ncbi:hypothetical protein BU15DRAFT_68104 [Melanogaster broomeanus]|nr:hypothetical protein BU15DRAFT_68104 [Melanogaster broomeanus]
MPEQRLHLYVFFPAIVSRAWRSPVLVYMATVVLEVANGHERPRRESVGRSTYSWLLGFGCWRRDYGIVATYTDSGLDAPSGSSGKAQAEIDTVVRQELVPTFEDEDGWHICKQ